MVVFHRPFFRMLMLLLLMLGMIVVSERRVAADAVPVPQKSLPTGDCWIDSIYYGAEPANSASGRVLVFVHGLGGSAQDWWLTPNSHANEPEDMWQVVYNAGYRSAYVSLGIPTNEFAPSCQSRVFPQNSWADNGNILAKQIDTIRAHYGVSTVDVVAHSKGGVDIQSAIVNYTNNPDNHAASQIRDVFFLGSPLQGSLVADKGCPLSKIVLGGNGDPASCSLQTAVVQQQFRPVADASPLNALVKYYIGAGNICRPDNQAACSADKDGLPGGATMLAASPAPPTFGGPSDNVITVAETQLPYAAPLFLQSWSHWEETLGRNSFPYIQQILISQSSDAYLPLVTIGP